MKGYACSMRVASIAILALRRLEQKDQPPFDAAGVRGGTQLEGL